MIVAAVAQPDVSAVPVGLPELDLVGQQPVQRPGGCDDLRVGRYAFLGGSDGGLLVIGVGEDIGLPAYQALDAGAGRARKSAALRSGLAGVTLPRMRIWRPCPGQ